MVGRGQLELVESAAFHPILPLLPKEEIINQIKINHAINTSRFGKVYQPRGFYCPEMAYHPKLAPIIKKMGYQYIILGQISYNGHLLDIDNHTKYLIGKTELAVVFRNNKISQSFVPHAIIDLYHQGFNDTIITATDGELYGHHYSDWLPSYQTATSVKKITTGTLFEYIESLSKSKIIHPVASSWESSEAELKAQNPFALWQDPKNEIHQNLWALAKLALRLNSTNQKDPNHFASRLHLERGIASCTFWWASAKDFKLFNQPAWSPEEVEKGALELLNSIRSLTKLKPITKIKAEKIFLEIHKLIWTTHWSKHNQHYDK